MGISHYIKDIGRGKQGARALTREQAFDLMSQVLDARVTDLELGAFAVAMRIKGESIDELLGFLDAVTPRCIPVPAPRPIVVLPSYNGARRLPNLTPLLALLLAQQDVPVLVHGPAHDPGRITTAQILRTLGIAEAEDASAMGRHWQRREPAFVRIETLCPPLARLLDVRWVIGLRNPGHTVAKLLDPAPQGTALRVVNYTHPEYGRMLHTFLQAAGAHALLMRGTEGEPVADPRRVPRIDVFIAGTPQPALGVPAHEGVLTQLPLLPGDSDAATTAHYIQSVLSGEKPVPEPVQRQVECILQTLARLPLATGSTHERTA